MYVLNRDMSDPSEFPYPVFNDLGSVACGNVVHGNLAQFGDCIKSAFAFNESTDSSTEVSRDEIVVGDSEKKMCSSLATPLGMQSVIETCHSKTTITSLSPDLSNTSTLALDGNISWDSDDACLYLSASKNFRFRFVDDSESDFSRLVLEGLDSDTSEYKTKAEFISS